MNGERSLLVAAEVGLAAVTLAAVLGMGRLFDGSEWLGPLTAHALAAHLVVAVARRRGLSLQVTAIVATGAAVLLATWTWYFATSAYGLPTGATWTAMQADLERSWTLYQDVVAPAPVETGFVLASAIAIWFVAYIADWAAFRLRVPFEASLPAGTLFLFTALLGADRGRAWAVALYASAVLAFLLLHRTSREGATGHWVGGRGAQGHRSLLAAGTALGVIAVVTGTVLGPLMPGAESPGVIDPRSLRDGSQSRVTISPLVDIRSRLVDQRNIEVFQVRSPRPSYWRLTSLDQFDGRIWSSSGSYAEASGDLPRAISTDLKVETFDQEFSISALSAIWLPNAYEPRSIDASDVGILYEEASSTLIVDSDVDSSDQLTYRVTSESPRITQADLAGAGGSIPAEIRERFLDLPDGFSPSVRALADEVTASATTPYESALALQDHLRTFTYDLDVGAGHSDNVLEQFLFETRRGYCEQFAGSFAAMARSIGLPARVAVGFTQGEVDASDPSLFRVRGEHAHAWPEVFLAGAGWVSFEPTPGRGQPFAEEYTGVPVSQAATADPGSATTAPPTTAGEPSPTIPDPSSGPQIREDELATGAGEEADGDSSAPRAIADFVTGPVRQVAPFVVAAVLAYLLLVPLALASRRWVRRRRATTPAERISLAWTEASEEAALVGFEETASETFDERAARLGALMADPAASDHAVDLARRLEVAAYSAEGADELDAELAEESGLALIVAARRAAPRSARLTRWLDPRLALRRRKMGQPAHRRITTTVRGDLEAERELVRSGDRR
ncbi:MAG: transglutaminaseTgpA domain-containing protein [Actinomycetota bacterium]